MFVSATVRVSESGVRFVTTLLEPAAALSAIYKGDTAPFHIRNS